MTFQNSVKQYPVRIDDLDVCCAIWTASLPTCQGEQKWRAFVWDNGDAKWDNYKAFAAWINDPKMSFKTALIQVDDTTLYTPPIHLMSLENESDAFDSALTFWVDWSKPVIVHIPVKGYEAFKNRVLDAAVRVVLNEVYE